MHDFDRANKAAVRCVKAIGFDQLRTALVKRLNNVGVSVPTGYAICNDRPHICLSLLTEALLLDDRTIKAYEQPEVSLRDLQGTTGLEKHVHRCAIDRLFLLLTLYALRR